MALLQLQDEPQLIQACFHGDANEIRAIIYNKTDEVNYQVSFGLQDLIRCKENMG